MAIEYDGEQHFDPVKFGTMSDESALIRLERQREMDKIKNVKVKENNKDVKFFVRISCKDKKLLCEQYMAEILHDCGLLK